MTGIVPDEGTCDGCGKWLSSDDGYVVIEDGVRYRFCDECPEDDA